MQGNARRKSIGFVAGALAVAALSAGAVAAEPARTVAAPDAVAAPCTIRWDGGGATTSWAEAANWTPLSGSARSPQAADVVCVTLGAKAASIDAPVSVAEVRWTDGGAPDVTISSSLAVAGRATFGRLALVGGADLAVDELLWTVPSTADGTGQPVVVDATTGMASAGLAVSGALVLSGTTTLAGTTTVPAGASVSVAGVPGEFPRTSTVAIDGTLDLRGGGSFTNRGPVSFSTSQRAENLGPAPTLRDVEVNASGSVTVVVTDRSSVSSIFPGATVRVVPGGPGDDEVDVDDLVNLRPNEGTLVLDGTATDLVQADGGGGPLVNAGRLVVDHAYVQATLENHGRAELGPESTFRLHSMYATDHVNDGTIVIGGQPDPGGSAASARFLGTVLRNTGTIADDGTGTGELVPVGSGIQLGGTVSVPVRGEDGGYVRALPGPRVPIPAARLADGAAAAVVGGRTSAVSGTVTVADTTTVSEDTGITANLTTQGLCPGDHFPILRTGALDEVAPPQMDTSAITGSKKAGPIEPVITGRPTGYVLAITGGDPTTAYCRFTLGDRAASLVFVEGLGRYASPAELGSWSPKSRTNAGQTVTAGRLLGTLEARRWTVAEEYARILGRPPTAGEAAYWSGQLPGRRTAIDLRMTLLGSSEAYARSGGSANGFAEALYRSELGRAIDPSGRARVQAQLAGGATRVEVARGVIRSAEGRRALAARLILIWWARPSTAAERQIWGDRLGADEVAGTARLAATAPGT